MTTETRAAPDLDLTQVESAVNKTLGDIAGFFSTLMLGIGDQLGLFKDLAAHGPATSAELATRTGTQERYVREWLGAVASGGYLRYDPSGGRFELPLAYMPVLAQEAGPAFFASFAQMAVSLLPTLDTVQRSFLKGGGVSFNELPQNYWEHAARVTSGWIDNLLVPAWLPQLPPLQAKLEQGIRVADVGCGRGRALVTLARAFPESRFTGYDIHGPNVDAATVLAVEAGVGDRVTFRQLDVAAGLPAQYDLITVFDTLHDVSEPLHVLRRLRQALTTDGMCLCLEFNSADTVEGIVGMGLPGVFLYSSSIFFCLTTALAHGGESLGAEGLPEAKLRQLAADAGFATVNRVPIEHPINALYALQVGA
jgi:SAM-dependent methyltransferase